MKALRQHPPGGIANLVLEEIETPSIAPGEVLIRVHAAALTRDELNWSRDRLPAIPSYELSGEVAELGDDVSGFRMGDAVFGMTSFERDGVAAEFTAVPVGRLAPKPEILSHTQAAAIPLAGLSAWQGLFDKGHLQEGERILIHGGGGGVGLFAVQLARRAGAHVTATASGVRAQLVREVGAHEVIVSSTDLTQIEPVSLVFDTVGGTRLQGSAAVVKPRGRIVSVAERPPPGLGRDRGVESVFFIVEPNIEQLAALGRLAGEGALRVLIDSTFPLDLAPAAFERLQSGDTSGKVVLKVRD